MKTDLKVKIKEATEYLKGQVQFEAETGIILGTGLGGVAGEIEVTKEVSYENIPYFPLSTVEYHSGKLIFGKLENKSIIAMQGRMHFYEGYSMQEITFPVRVLHGLGIKNLVITNACGSLNPYFKKGSIMIIDDHINLLGSNPLIGPNDDELGPRFPDMSRPYSQKFIEILEQIALDLKIRVVKGVYAAMSGPSLETRAEYRMLRIIGADVIGMSTIPEVIVANHMSMKVLGLSILTDECYPDSLKPVSVEKIITVAGSAEPDLTKLVREFIKKV